MRADVKIDADLFLECSLEFLLKIIDKLCYPAVVFIVFLAVADEDIVFVSGDEACHVEIHLYKVMKELDTRQIKFLLKLLLLPKLFKYTDMFGL